MAVDDGIRTGLFFGATSGVITPCGLLVGLAAGTGSVSAVISGILIVAFADALSDALGIHLAEESTAGVSSAQVWTATAVTFISKLVVALSFAVPFFLLGMQVATAVALLWGALLLALMSWQIARLQSTGPAGVIAEHLGVGTVVVLLSHYLGVWLRGLGM